MGFDLLSPFGGDVEFGPAVDVSTAGLTGADFDFLVDRDELIQRIIRRLLTDPGEWIPFPNYGAGLRRFVNETLDNILILKIKNIILGQLLQEPDVSENPPPSVAMSLVNNGLYVAVRVFSQDLGQVSFAFSPNQAATVASPIIFRPES